MESKDLSVEAGWFLNWTAFDNSLRIDDFFAGGGHLAVGLAAGVAIEGDASRSVTNGPPGERVTYIPLRVRVMLNRRLAERIGAEVGAGFVHNRYGATRSGTENGATALVGVRYAFSRGLGLRVGFVADYMPSPMNEERGAGHTLNIGVRQGLSYAFGGDAETEPAVAAVPEPVDPGPSDGDGDGVPDLRDRCPDTPRGELVDAQGCPLDSDGDGVKDSQDRCPGTAAGVAVDASGCALDSDGDGVPDRIDRCPDTPKDIKVDASGCPLDSDNDGVPDGIDRCPHTSPGTRVGIDGCVLLFEENRRSVVLEGVHFEDGLARLMPDSRTILDNVAESLVANPEFRIRVEGHTSSTGTRAFNVRLSHDRANTVRDYLIAHGVAPDRLAGEGYGPDRPVDTNETLEGQARNRRVELVRLD